MVDISSARSLATVRTSLAAEAVCLGVPDVDAASVRESAGRRFTQIISRFIYEQPVLCAGVFYLSRYGNDVADYAISERSDRAQFPVTHVERSGIELDDEDLRQASKLHASLRAGRPGRVCCGARATAAPAPAAPSARAA